MGGREAGVLTGVRAPGRGVDLSRRQAAMLSVLMLGPLFIVAHVSGVTEFSPDSWSYFELSKSVFSDRFYAFNTYRGYFSETYSASFPLGYPVVLAVAGALFGAQPWLAVAVNLLVAAASWFLIIAICRRAAIPSLHALGLCATLVLFPGYLDEIYTGRAIPLAILMVLLGVHVSLKRAGFLAGLFIGLSAIVRFDFLPYALLILAAGSLFWPREPGLVASRFIGFAVALLPWITYSRLHFGKLWVSDNGWVALSAIPAFVLDFPARATVPASAEPLLWLRRVIGNGNDALLTFASNLWQVPVLVGLVVILIVNFGKLDPVWRKRLAVAAAACGLGVSPYLLTGYFDVRYFGFLYLTAAFALAGAVTGMRGGDAQPLTNGVLIACIVLALIVAGQYHLDTARRALARAPAEARIAATIGRLDACQRQEPGRTYIFRGGEGMGLVFRYGALTGHRAAAIPSNFDRLSARDRKAYFARLAPYHVVEHLPDDIPCGER